MNREPSGFPSSGLKADELGGYFGQALDLPLNRWFRLSDRIHAFSAGIGGALLDLRLGSGLGPCGKREDSCVLPFIEPRQQHDVAIGELERV